MKKMLTISELSHSWFIDIDGTVCKHNGYKIDGYDTLLPGVKEFIDSLPNNDLIIFVTSRTDEYKDVTVKFLKDNDIRYDYIFFNVPHGERILINDYKPSGLKTSIAINLKRNKGLKNINISFDDCL